MPKKKSASSKLHTNYGERTPASGTKSTKDSKSKQGTSTHANEKRKKPTCVSCRNLVTGKHKGSTCGRTGKKRSPDEKACGSFDRL